MAKPTIALPNWATEDVIDPVTGRINVQEPPESKIEQGLARGDFIPRQWFNWLFRSIGKWSTFFDSENDARISEIEGLGNTVDTYNLNTNIRIDNEIQDRSDADGSLQSNIDAEAATRAGEDVAIRYDLGVEAGFREAGDTNILLEMNALRFPEVLSLQGADGNESSNSGTGETTLYTFVIPGGKMIYDGDHVEIDAHVFFGTGSGQKSLRCFVDSTDIFDNGPCTGVISQYGRLRITIVRKITSPSYTGWAVPSLNIGLDSSGSGTKDFEGRYVSGGLFGAPINVDWSIDQTVTIRGQAADGSNRVKAQYLMAKFTPVSKAA